MLRAVYEREVERHLLRSAPASTVLETDLAGLPLVVQVFLRRVGVVGKPRVRNLRALFRAEFRRSSTAKWMPASAEQYNSYDPPARLFFMRARQLGIPFDAFHRYIGEAATMEVKVLGVIPVVAAGGPEMTQSETVTMLNDMCFLAPAALLDADISWQAIDEGQVRATFTNAGKTVSAVLSFDDHGDLVGFLSHDRYQSDGRSHRLLPWSTPLSGHRDFGGYRLPAKGEARWQEPSGEWAYGRFLLLEIAYNVGK